MDPALEEFRIWKTEKIRQDIEGREKELDAMIMKSKEAATIQTSQKQIKKEKESKLRRKKVVAMIRQALNGW
jgi:transposase